jgi:hypothetical protein
MEEKPVVQPLTTLKKTSKKTPTKQKVKIEKHEHHTDEHSNNVIPNF